MAFEFTGEKALKLGDRGTDVHKIQDRLISLGYLGKREENYGITTKKAVMQLQKHLGVEQTGIWGDKLNSFLSATEDSLVDKEKPSFMPRETNKVGLGNSTDNEKLRNLFQSTLDKLGLTRDVSNVLIEGLMATFDWSTISQVIGGDVNKWADLLSNITDDNRYLTNLFRGENLESLYGLIHSWNIPGIGNIEELTNKAWDGIEKSPYGQYIPQSIKDIFSVGNEESGNLLDNIQDKAKADITGKVHTSGGITVDYIPCYIINLNTDTKIEFNIETPEEITDSSTANFTDQTVRGRSSPFKAYENSGPRSISFSVILVDDYRHGGLVNTVNALRALVYPHNDAYIIAPQCLLRIGDFLNIKCVPSDISVTWRKPYREGIYTVAEVSITVSEVESEGKSTVEVENSGIQVQAKAGTEQDV
nr:MAG TPA: putative peptidoglycan binding domain protein [Caudoviricetes sp.]